MYISCIRTNVPYPRTRPPSWDHGTRYVIGQVGREELDYFGAVLNRPEPSQGHQLRAILIALNAAGDHRRHNSAGGDHSRSDAVRGYAEGTEMLGEIAGVVGDSPPSLPRNGHSRRRVTRRSRRRTPR